MSRPHDIDNLESVFQFDSFEESLGSLILEDSPRHLDSTISSLEVRYPVLPSSRSNAQDMSREEDFMDKGGKGKGVSKPMPIPTIDNPYHVFDVSPSEAGPSSHADVRLRSCSFSPSSFAFEPPQLAMRHDLMLLDHDDDSMSDSLIVPVRKDKGKEVPPTLPPLAFSPTEFGYDKVGWPSPGLITPPPGPSSYESAFGSLTTDSSPPNPPNSASGVASPPIVTDASPYVRSMPSRRRSLSYLSIHSAPSLAAFSMSGIKGKVEPPKGSNNIARKLLFKKREDAFDSPVSDQAETPIIPPELGDVGPGNCFIPWLGDSKARKYNPTAVPLSNLDIDVGLPLYPSPHVLLKGKARSYSSPLPASALDLIPVAAPVVSEPIPIVVRNYFEEFPKELRLQVLSLLVALHEAEYQRWEREGLWTALRASSSKNKWVGRNRGIRELVKFSRVSKSWQALVFDGQLWQDLDLRSFPRMPASLILRLAEVAGSFVRTLDMSGHVNVLSMTLTDLTSHLSLHPSLTGQLSYTQLTSVNLQGCAGLTTRSLHHLLIRSPALQNLCLKGLCMVTNTTCDVISAYCPHLTSLDMSRCSGVDGSGVQTLAAAATLRGDHLLLQELRLSGLKYISDATMAALGKAAPYLEVLDLSYVRHLHNSSLEAFVSCEEEEGLGVETILLNPREAGRDPGDSRWYRRRITRLRHILLSSCVLLTDVACSNLAHATPHLEFLEMAGIGAELRDAGLVHLLKTTPFIRKLDLEDASNITDAVISTITPSPVPDPPVGRRPPEAEPGHALEHLVVSYAMHVSNEALLALVRGCPRLTVLEADNTHMSGTVSKEFVRVACKRRAVDAKVVAVDCRGMGESLVKELSANTRPRLGWRSHDARKLRYLDGGDGEDLKVGQDECDGRKVVLKTFYSWQTVDAVRAAREKRRKLSTRRVVNDFHGGASDDEEASGTTSLRSARARWWSPVGNGRRISGANTPATTDMNTNDGCRIM